MDEQGDNDLGRRTWKTEEPHCEISPFKVVKAVALRSATNPLPRLEVMREKGYGTVKGFSNTTKRYKIKRNLGTFKTNCNDKGPKLAIPKP